LVCFFIDLFNTGLELKVEHGKHTKLLTYIIWKDISSCFNSNNVWVVIEDFESHRTVILVCKKTQNDNNKNYCQILTINFQWTPINHLLSAFLWKFSFTSSLTCRGYKSRMKFELSAYNQSNRYAFQSWIIG